LRSRHRTDGIGVVLPKTDLRLLDPSLRAITDLPVGWQAERKVPRFAVEEVSAALVVA
jgi:hypothetical protein